MKNKFKHLITFVLLSILVIPFTTVHAENIRIDQKSYIKTGTRTEAKFHTNKGYAFCITPDRVGADQGASLRYMSKETKGGVLYLLEKTGTNDHDYLKTQLAIWLLKNNYMPDYYVQNSNIEVVRQAKSLAAEAKKQGNYSLNTTEATINTSNTTMELTSDGKYYKSSVITVGPFNGLTKHKVDIINAPSGTEMKTVQTDKKDNASRFEIWVPASSVTASTTIKLKATAYAKNASVERYTPGDGHQDLVVLHHEDKTFYKELSLNIKQVVRKCEFVNNQYYGKDGNVVTKEEYEIQCESHVCEKIGDRYFGKLGTLVTEEQFKQECFTHTCEKVGDKYYGRDGREVIETDYKAQCEPQKVVVPDTDSSRNILFIVIGSVLVGTVIGTVTYYHDKKKIMN